MLAERNELDMDERHEGEQCGRDEAIDVEQLQRAPGLPLTRGVARGSSSCVGVIDHVAIHSSCSGSIARTMCTLHRRRPGCTEASGHSTCVRRRFKKANTFVRSGRAVKLEVLPAAKVFAVSHERLALRQMQAAMDAAHHVGGGAVGEGVFAARAQQALHEADEQPDGESDDEETQQVHRKKIVVGVRGFDPPAPASRKQCSTKLSYTPNKENKKRRKQQERTWRLDRLTREPHVTKRVLFPPRAAPSAQGTRWRPWIQWPPWDGKKEKG